jgi:phosphoribosylanthranilate isomerase
MFRASELALNGLFVKICGITNEEDALLAVAMGADAISFVFAAGSTRQVTATQVADIVKRLPPDITTLGVFKNEHPDRVVEIVHRCGLTGAQLHGHETADQCRSVAQRVNFVVQAFAAGDKTIDRARDYPVEVVLLDNPKPGSGELFDWSLVDGVPDGKKLLLAGGLDPDNITDAVTKVRPWGVDVSTGTEASPGRKDARKVRAFVANARAAAAQIPQYQQTTNDENALDSLTGQPYDWQEEF